MGCSCSKKKHLISSDDLGPEPKDLVCPKCNEQITTETFIVFLEPMCYPLIVSGNPLEILCVACMCLILITDYCVTRKKAEKITHKCPKCKTTLGFYKKK